MLCDGKLALQGQAAAAPDDAKCEVGGGGQRGAKRAHAASERPAGASDEHHRVGEGTGPGQVGGSPQGTPNKKLKGAGQQGKGEFDTPLGKQAPAAMWSSVALTPELEAAPQISF